MQLLLYTQRKESGMVRVQSLALTLYEGLSSLWVGKGAAL